jgi:hypothetical protein
MNKDVIALAMGGLMVSGFSLVFQEYQFWYKALVFVALILFLERIYNG